MKPGDILVGKVTPKGESPMTPEEKLLRAIFGEKAADVRDTSLQACRRASTGTVVEVRVFNRRGVDKDERALAIERDEIERLAKDRDDEKAILERSFYSQLQELLMNQTVAGGFEGPEAGHARSPTRCWASITPGQWRQIARQDRQAAWPRSRRSKQAVRRVDRSACRTASTARSTSCSAATSCRRA